MAYKCKNCSRSYEESGLKDLANTFTGKNWISQKGFCSDKCKVEYENNHKKENKSSHSNMEASTSKTKYVKQEKTAEQIRAEAEVKKIERDEEANQPWKFDSNFNSAENISKLIFPDVLEDVEKTINKINSSAIEKIKSILDQTYTEYNQSNVGDQKALWKPYYQEINFVNACIEKIPEGIKKLKRFDPATSTVIIDDCKENLEDLKNNWYKKLIEKRDKRKKTLTTMIIVVIILFSAMMIGLGIAS